LRHELVTNHKRGFTTNPLRGAGEETELPESAKKPTYYTYIYSDEVSFQRIEPLNKIEIDTVNLESYGKSSQRIDSIINATNLFHFKNFKEDIYRLDYKKNNKDFSIRDHIPKYQWKLIDGNKTIAGFLCKRATATIIKMGRKQNLVAWYCEDIPINDGLLDFNGLPGLILEVEINDLTRITFEKIIIDPKEKIDILEPERNSNSLTIKEYENMIMGTR